MTTSNARQVLSWQSSVPIFKSSVIVQQLGIALGIPFGLVALVILLTSGRSRDTLYALGFILTLLFLTWILILLVYGGSYDAEFVLDYKGALCRTQAEQAKKNRALNTLTVALGLLSGRPSAAGAGMLAQSRQEVFIPWNHVTKAEYKPRSHTILLRSGFTEHIALFCTQDNYEQAEGFVKDKLFRREGIS